MFSSSVEVSRLLKAWGQGDESALGRLIPLVQQELHRLAHRYMSRERPDHTLQTTALVNEVYLRLVHIATGKLAGQCPFLRHRGAHDFLVA